ncbi:hypothetical protein E2320_005002 [Naja naja]|nr:hypothetical protein E2320_005002 [Naja naja]
MELGNEVSLSPNSCMQSRESLSEDEDQRDLALSEDEGLFPDPLAFTGLFSPALFKSLLHKAKTMAHMGVDSHPSEAALGLQDPSEGLFLN